MKPDSPTFVTEDDVTAFAGALWFALVGVCLALTLAAALFPVKAVVPPISGELLPSQLPQITAEHREKAFLALAAVLGAAGPFLGARVRPVRRINGRIALYFVMAVPFFNLVCRLSFQPDSGPVWAALACVVLVAAGRWASAGDAAR